MPRNKGRILLSLLCIIERIHIGYGTILSTAAMDVRNTANPSQSYTLLASQGEFGRYPPMTAKKNTPMSVALSPEDDPLLCNNDEANGISSDTSANSNDTLRQKTALLVPRGTCSFERKALAAQRLGASAIIIYGNLASRYSINSTTTITTTSQDLLFPKPFYDYDCNLTSSYIPENLFSFNPLPYNSQINDRLLSGSESDGNLCAKDQPNFKQTCPSQKCLLTGVRKNLGSSSSSSSSSSSYMQACCAWDTYIWLYADSTIDNRTSDSLITIQVFYITMESADILLQTIQSVPSQYLTLTLYTRYAPESSLSSVLIWILGVFVAALAAYLSASDIRLASAYQYQNKTINSKQSTNKITSNTRWERIHTIHMEEDDKNYHDKDNKEGDDDDEEEHDNHRNSSSSSSSAPHTYSQQHSDTVEMTAVTAVGFMIVSTISLLIIFYFKIYAIVKIFYAIGSGSALAQVIWIPLVSYLLNQWNILDKGYCYVQFLDIGAVNRSEMIGYLIAYSLSISWLIVSFILPHPGENFFFWFLQDVIGICMCITFLQAIQINSIKVATILLVIAFVYDIFFVFISPHLTGGKSIMIDVATSGGPPQVDPSWCEKYPRSSECKGGDPLPVLLTIPRFDDYRGGSALLGLGDILLPGLLLSFAARYDEAKKYIGLVSGGRGQVHSTCPELQPCTKYSCLTRLCMGGYFPALVLSYAVGLSMANIAVNVMKMGQPALLYLVPCCLGTICILGWRRGELRNLWETPRVLQLTNEYLHPQDQTMDISTSTMGRDANVQTSKENSKTDTETEVRVDVEVQSPLLKIV